MRKIYNINNNKIAHICFYHYIDEIIQPSPWLAGYKKNLIAILEKRK